MEANTVAGSGEGVNATPAPENVQSVPRSNEAQARYIAKDPVGFAIMDFGRSLRNIATFLLIVDILFSVIFALSGSNSHDRYRADFYDTVSRELHATASSSSDISFYVSGLLVNVTLLALTVGRGIYKIGRARMGEEVEVGQNIVDSLHSKFFTRIEAKAASPETSQ